MCPCNEQQTYESQAGILHVSSVIFYPENTSFCYVVVGGIEYIRPMRTAEDESPFC